MCPGCAYELSMTPLQLCRPLSGAVRSKVLREDFRLAPLQLCRPLSGAVRPTALVVDGIDQLLQLCRPLSGAVRHCGVGERIHGVGASIVPPPFGSG